VEVSLKEVKEWKKNAQTVLRRLHMRLEKELERAKEEENKIV
jgi:DNA topoisomerase IA